MRDLICQNFAVNPESWKIVKWVIACYILMVVSVTHIFTVPYFTEAHHSSNSTSHLNQTLYHSFDQDWLCFKLVFFSGFALSQFTVGFLAEAFGHLTALKWTTKLLILSGFVSTVSENSHLFLLMWFFVAYGSSSSFLLCIGQVLDMIEALCHNKKWRLALSLLFMFSWTTGRFQITLIAFLNKKGDWQLVMFLISLALTMVYFWLDSTIWNPLLLKEKGQEESLFSALVKEPKVKLNLLILSLTWFTLGYNFYGMMNSYPAFNEDGENNIFEHNLLAAVLAVLSVLCAIFLSSSVSRSNLPLSVLQFCCALAYFIMVLFEFKEQSPPQRKSLIFVAHMSSFLETAAFDLVWIITPAVFSRQYRTSATGVCSGFARIGAIVGVTMGEYDFLHRNIALLCIAGFLTLLSALLINALPETASNQHQTDNFTIQCQSRQGSMPSKIMPVS